MVANLAELRAMLGAATAEVLAAGVGELAVDPDGHQVSWRGRPLSLTRLERDVLVRLASAPLGLWTYERLFHAVWGGAYLGDTAILHSTVKRLRRKLRDLDGAPELQTVRGVGYHLLPAAAPVRA
ncbi:winged helix-turn-helix domain-containing protein [Phytohabitans kaempferiae]|uniref:Winged helix-turn-helix domain-containing protein n=1 Tax=Phytohabitans kaempferiae TaxID=1620943 RepID=A0ABV6M3M4_9ACTN